MRLALLVLGRCAAAAGALLAANQPLGCSPPVAAQETVLPVLVVPPMLPVLLRGGAFRR